MANIPETSVLWERYQSGKTMREIAAEFKIDRKTVARRFNLAGYSVRSSGPSQRLPVGSGLRRCSNCHQVKPLEEFGRSSRAYGQGRDYRCTICLRERSRRRNIKTCYGITLEQFNQILSAQGGGCLICHSIDGGTRHGRKKRMAVDHCHKTGKIRGILCPRCNLAIGLFREHPGSLQRAFLYLQNKRLR